MSIPLKIKDQMERDLIITSAPKRIISLVPSITELLHDLGLQEEVVGLTKFCIHPKRWCSTKTRIGGTKKINFDRVSELQPDLIIANKEENTREDINELEKHYNVFMTDVNTFEDALDMIKQISEICDRVKQGKKLLNQLINLRNSQISSQPKSVIYLIWKDPFYAVGTHTFINDMMKLAGFKNLVTAQRYPEISIEEINKLNPELLLLSTEPYPFDLKYLSVINAILDNSIPILIDGEMFSWYGSRLLKSFDYFKQLKTELESK